MITLTEALHTVDGLKLNFETCLMPLFHSIGNFYATDVYATRDFPPFNRSAVDGYAYNTELTHALNQSFKIVATIYAGDSSPIASLQANECVKIMTGASVPLCCNCVVRVEDAEKLNDDTVVLKTETITKSYQNIARKGEDCKLNDLVFEKGLRIKQTHLSTLAAMGITQVVCYKAIEIPIINTGNEIVEPGKALPSENSIFESNSTAIKSLLKNYPVQFQSKIVQDNWDSLNEAVKKNQSAPLLLFTGGVSAGDADYVPKVLEANGYTCLFHKVAMKPGKPVWLGINAKKQLAIGLPGNPISVMVNVKLMVERILRNSFAAIHTHYVTDFNIHKEIKRPTKSLDVLQLYTFKNYSFDFNSTNGSGDILNTANSEGFVILPAGAEFIEKGILYPWVSEL